MRRNAMLKGCGCGILNLRFGGPRSYDTLSGRSQRQLNGLAARAARHPQR